MKGNSVFLVLVLGFFSGVATHSFFIFPTPIIYFLLLVSSAVFIYFLTMGVFSKERETEKVLKVFVLVAIVAVSFSVGLLRYNISVSKDESAVASYVGKSIKAIGQIIDEPDKRENSVLLSVEIESVFISGEEVGADEKILLVAERYPEFNYGDKVSFEGILQKPKPFETDAGRIFDYPSYLAKDGIFYTMFRPRLELLDEGGGNFIKRNLFILKSSFLDSAGKYISEPEVSLLGGLLVGAKHGLSKELQEDLRNAGIIHIVVLSGYNITIVAEAIMYFFQFLVYKYRLIVGVASIALFAIMTGGSATVVRASIMALIVLLAKATGRTYEITRALMLAGLVMVFHNPKILIFDPSFELSFLATLGLVYLAPAIEKYFNFVPTKFKTREFILATISTQIFVLPLLLLMTGQVSVFSLPSNMLVLFFIPATMLLGFITGVIGFVSQILSFPFAYITYLLLHYELFVASFFGNISWSTVSVSSFGALAMVLSYTGIFLFLFFFHRKHSKSVNENL